MIPKAVKSEDLERIVKEAGRILLSYFHQPLSLNAKDQDGFVTEADIASEKYLIEQLGLLLPQASFQAEESGKVGSGEYCWVIDPLDGTSNFAHQIPYFCISVALTYHDKPIIGVIYQPVMNEFFYAQKGAGTYLNGQKLEDIASKNQEWSMIAVGFPYEKKKQFVDLLGAAQRILPETYSFRCFGAAALDLAYVAAGRLNGAISEGLKWWDVAAGIVLIEEAGGRATDFRGQEITPSYVSFVAANRPMHEKLIQLLPPSTH